MGGLRGLGTSMTHLRHAVASRRCVSARVPAPSRSRLVQSPSPKAAFTTGVRKLESPAHRSIAGIQAGRDGEHRVVPAAPLSANLLYQFTDGRPHKPVVLFK